MCAHHSGHIRLTSSYWRFQPVLFSKCFCMPHETTGKMRKTSVTTRGVLLSGKVVAGFSNLCLPVFNTQTISLQCAVDHQLIRKSKWRTLLSSRFKHINILSIYLKFSMGLKIQPSGWEFSMHLQEGLVGFPALAWYLTAACNSKFKRSDSVFWSLQALGNYTTCIHT